MAFSLHSRWRHQNGSGASAISCQAQCKQWGQSINDGLCGLPAQHRVGEEPDGHVRRIKKAPRSGSTRAAYPCERRFLWLPRSAVVAALSSLDAYVHAVLDDRIPHALMGNPIPDALCDAMASIIPIKNASSFRQALPIISTANVHAELTTRLSEQTLSFLSYQAPEKILAAYDMIGRPSIFDSVSAIWPGPRTTSDNIKRFLANYVRRRNQIAHEGDREASGAVRHMRPIYANNCADFVENLVSRLNRAVYGP